MNRTAPTAHLIAFLQLGKATISLPVALTGFLGYFLFQPTLDRNALLSISGIFFLSMGSGAINQIQERRSDALMPRTAERPIPSGRVTILQAVVFASLATLTGAFLLWLTEVPLAAGLGLFTLLWYNLVYTPLKKVTAFAVLPGALIGALPPLIGWSAAGGEITDLRIITIAFLLFVGQMPHYWLLMLKVGNEFRQAGLPVITTLFEPEQIRNLSFIWIAATGVIVMMLPATPIIRNRAISMLLVVAAVAFMIRMFRLIYRGELLDHWKKAFITVNLFYLVIILVLIADRILSIYL